MDQGTTTMEESQMDPGTTTTLEQEEMANLELNREHLSNVSFTN